MQSRWKTFALIVTSCALIAFAANLLVDNPYTHQLIRIAINDKLQQETNLTVDFKAIKVRLVPPGLDLYGLAVAPAMAQTQQILAVSQVRAKVSIWSLFMGKPRLSSLELNDPSLVWPPPWNFPGFVKEPAGVTRDAEVPPSWPPDFDLPIDRLLIKNGQAFVETPNFAVPERANFAAVALIGLDADISYKNWQHIGVELSVNSLDASAGASSFLESTALELHGDLVNRRFSIHQLQARGERLRAEASGDLDLLQAEGSGPISALALALHTKVDGDFSLIGSYLEIADTHGPVVGNADITATIPLEKGSKGGFKVAGKAEVKDAWLGGFRLFNSRAEFAIDDHALSLPKIELIVDKRTIGEINGEIKFDEPLNFDFHGKPVGLHLLDLFDALGVANKDADLTLDSPDLHVSGTGFPLAIHVGANARVDHIVIPALGPPDKAFPVSPVCQTKLAVEVTSAQVDFTGSSATCSQPDGSHPSPVTVSGAITFGDKAAIDVRVKSPAIDLDLAQYFLRVPLAGDAVNESFIHGPLSHVLIDSKTTATGVEVLAIPLGTVQAQTQVDKLKIRWDRVSVKPDEGGELTATAGQIEMDVAGYPVHTHLQAQGIATETVQALFKAAGLKQDFSFALAAADGDFAGPLLTPLTAHTKMNFELKDGVLGDETLFDSAKGAVKADQRGWSSPGIVLNLGNFSASAKFNHERVHPGGGEASNVWVSLGLGAKDRFNLSFQTLTTPVIDKGTPEPPIDNLAFLPFAGEILGSAGIRGEIEAQGELSGTIEDIQGTFTASLNQVQVMGSGMANINSRGFVHGQHVDLMLEQGGNALEGRLSLDLMKDGVPFDWYFSCNRMDLRLLGTTFFSSDPRNYLYLSGDWRMHGTFADWWHAQGELNIKDLRANYVQNIGTQTKTLAVRQEQPSKLLFTKSGWRFADDKGLFLSGTDIQLSLGTSDSRPPERLGFKFTSVIDIGLAKEFFHEVETAEGKVRIAGELFGPASDPRPTVVINDLKPTPLTAATWKPLTLGIADIRPAFRNINLHLIYRDGRMIIDRFTAEKGTGNVRASGSLNLASTGGDETHIDLNLNDTTVIFPVAFLKSFETQMSGNIVVSGQGLPYKVAGDVVINRARSTREVDIRDEIINALRQKSIGSALVAEKPTVVLDLNLSANKSINIHNRNLQAKLSSDLHIKGTDIAPVVSGQVEVNKGKFIYKQEFNITRGLVTFDDQVKPDPSLDILALSEVDTYRVYIAVTGRASNPTVEFSIDPPTRETGTPINKLDILVLLSSGKLPEEARAQGQDSQNAATSEAANLILGQFEEPMEKLLESSGQNVVRSVYFDTHPAPDGSPVPRINLPVDLGDNIDFVLRTDQATSEVSLEYNVNESIAVSGVREIQHAKDQQPTQPTPGEVEGDSKVNLKFRFSFE